MAINYRKKYFIKKDFQTRFILRFVVAATVWAAATVVLFVMMAERRLDEIRYSTHIMARTTADVLLPSTLGAQMIAMVVFSLALVYAVYDLWRRLSTPLYSIKKDLARIASGDLVSTVTLREDDEFQDLASGLDGMRSDLRNKIARIKEHHAGLVTAAEGLQKSVYKGDPSPAPALLLREAVGRIKEDVNEFQC